MERKRLGTALMIVSCMGVIIAAVGKFVASGVGLGETAIIAFDTTFLFFICFFFVSMAVFGQDNPEDEQNQPEAELDSSLH